MCAVCGSRCVGQAVCACGGISSVCGACASVLCVGSGVCGVCVCVCVLCSGLGSVWCCGWVVGCGVCCLICCLWHTVARCVLSGEWCAKRGVGCCVWWCVVCWWWCVAWGLCGMRKVCGAGCEWITLCGATVLGGVYMACGVVQVLCVMCCGHQVFA